MLEGIVEGLDDHKRLWSISVDKVNQGINEIIRGMHPIRKAINRIFTAEEQKINIKKVSSDRIIVENFCGFIMSLWSIINGSRRKNTMTCFYVFSYRLLICI